MIYHAYSAYQSPKPDTQRRMKFAAETWKDQRWCEFPVPDSLIRSFRDEKSSVPFIRDLFDAACFSRQPDDIVVFTNSDICTGPTCCWEIAATMMAGDVCCCSRRDFQRLDRPLNRDEIGKGVHYPGLDLFAFRVRWWNDHGSEFPDMLLGREMWDLVMFCLMEAASPGFDVRLKNLIYHETHYQFWADHRNRSMKSQQHNVRLGREWLGSRNIDAGRFSNQFWT